MRPVQTAIHAAPAQGAGAQPAATTRRPARPAIPASKAMPSGSALPAARQAPPARPPGDGAGTQPGATGSRVGRARPSSNISGPASSQPALPDAPRVSHAKAAVAAGFQKLSTVPSSAASAAHARTAGGSGTRPSAHATGHSQTNTPDDARAALADKPSSQGALCCCTRTLLSLQPDNWFEVRVIPEVCARVLLSKKACCS